MKKIQKRQPPMIVLMDILMMFLLIFMIQQSAATPMADIHLYKEASRVSSVASYTGSKPYVLFSEGDHKVVVNGTLLQEMKNIFFEYCFMQGDPSCSSFKIPVGADGHIDMYQLYKDNGITPKYPR